MEENSCFDEEIISISMEIIMHAGDARLSVTKAFTAMQGRDFALAEECLAAAKKKLAQAHNRQTEVVQSEIEGQKRETPLLFAHAQDTLMTIFSEYNIARQMRGVLQEYETRLAAVEKALLEK